MHVPPVHEHTTQSSLRHPQPSVSLCLEMFGGGSITRHVDAQQLAGVWHGSACSRAVTTPRPAPACLPACVPASLQLCAPPLLCVHMHCAAAEKRWTLFSSCWYLWQELRFFGIPPAVRYLAHLLWRGLMTRLYEAHKLLVLAREWQWVAARLEVWQGWVWLVDRSVVGGVKGRLGGLVERRSTNAGAGT